MFDTGYGCSMLDTGCWMFDAGYWILDMQGEELSINEMDAGRFWILDNEERCD